MINLNYSLLKRLDPSRVLMSVVHVEQDSIFVCRKTDTNESISVQVYGIYQDSIGNPYIKGSQTTKIYALNQAWNGQSADEALTIVALRSFVPVLSRVAGYASFEERVMELIKSPGKDVPVLLYFSSTNSFKNLEDA